jgi:hypothetical protein
LTLEENVHLDLSIFFARFGVVDISLSVKVSDDYDTFLVVIIVKKPSETY